MAKEFFKAEDRKRIRAAIAEAEKTTSGEVRVHLEGKCQKDVLERAAEVFDILQMQKTDLRNGVLFYLAHESHKFAILGDAGITKKVGNNFWVEIKDHMREKFRQGRFTEGLEESIRMAGQALSEHFPYQSDDKNELSDDISFGSDLDEPKDD